MVADWYPSGLLPIIVKDYRYSNFANKLFAVCPRGLKFEHLPNSALVTFFSISIFKLNTDNRPQGLQKQMGY